MSSNRVARTSIALAVAATAALGLSACGAGESTASAADSSASSSFGRPEPVATIPAVPGGSTAVALDTGFTDALTQLGLTPGTVGSATLDGATGTITFPITGGTVTLFDRESGYRPWVQGTLFHEGSGLSLTAGGTTVELTDFTIDPGKPARLFGNVSVNGELAVPSAPLFDLDGSTLNPPTTSAGSAELDGTTVELSPEAAELLNATFGTDALTGGFVVGTSTITVETE
ncbi:hypothetical protein [Modestobacter roseus]|uniref:Htaa protein n=1 Tax=Modestobacter roseus TaxID=1181884 RepID=A0A562ILY9_9ACTN|nr:hypothetical protein [Modestobacter roseus]MQA33806.1 hypothetical protein [Modestobacter roseus]TWH72009.1 hypothetical protein JD78_00512 [Modestobacter roseus]